MRRRIGLVALILLVVAWGAGGGGVALAAPSQSLLRARAEFERGEYKKVIDTLSPELYPRTLLRDKEDLKEAHYLLGVSHYYLSRRDLARNEFAALLYLEPDHTLEAATESPEVYAFFEYVKGELKAQLEEVRKQKQREDELRRLPQQERLVERTIRETSPWSNFVPFGYGQFRNGQTGKGVFYLVSESLLGGASLALFTLQAVQYGIPSVYPPEKNDQIRNLQIVQVVTGGLFIGIYVVGVLDSFSNQKPKISEKTTVRPINKAAPPPKSSFLITPVVSPEGGVGVGAVWRF